MLRNGRDEFSVDYPYLIHRFVFILLHDGIKHRADVIGSRVIAEPRIGGLQIDAVNPAYELCAPVTNSNNVASNTSGSVFGNGVSQQFDDIGIISTGQATVARNKYIETVLHGTLFK